MYRTIQLSDFEQRGLLAYLTPSFEIKMMEGWFMLSLDRKSVIARRVRGRNHWQFCSLDRVLSFAIKGEQ